jgi:hypothetical protein
VFGKQLDKEDFTTVIVPFTCMNSTPSTTHLYAGNLFGGMSLKAKQLLAPALEYSNSW